MLVCADCLFYLFVSTSWKVGRLKEYLDVVSLPGLTDEEEALINETGSKIHHRFFVRHYTDECHVCCDRFSF